MPVKSKVYFHLGKAQFKDQNQTVEVAEGSIARLHCRVENRDQGEQIMWYDIKHHNRQVENLMAMCGVSKDVNEGERNDACISVNSQKDQRMRLELKLYLLSSIKFYCHNCINKNLIIINTFYSGSKKMDNC